MGDDSLGGEPSLREGDHGPAVDEAGNEWPAVFVPDCVVVPPIADSHVVVPPMVDPIPGVSTHAPGCIPVSDSWSAAYAASAQWSSTWKAMCSPEANWPAGARLHQNRQIQQERVAVPEDKVYVVLKECHAHFGHVVVKKLV